jgi:pyrrolidone-carboxylate peptidase
VRTLSGDRLRDLPSGIWGHEDGRGGRTELIVAGPAGPSARRPAAAGGARALTDWLPLLRSAGDAALLAVRLEAVLLEARSAIALARTVEAVRRVSEQAREVAIAAGQKVWDLAAPTAGTPRAAGTRTVNETHFQVLEALRAVLRRFRQDASSDRARRLFTLMEESFSRAARGGESISFTRPGQRGRILRVLVTGFDPFRFGARPRPGDFNPSGQAALALDGETIPVEGGAVAAVEGVVLPVSFEQFDTGLVERIVGPRLGELDAVITVSLYPRAEGETGLRLERYAVGVRLREEAPAERRAVPPAPGETERGAAIIETAAPLSEIGGEVEAAGLGPAVANAEFEFRFPSREVARQALGALGLPATAAAAQVAITDPTALGQIVRTMERGVDPDSPGIVFAAGGRRYQAIVVEGPGGSFLSNEVSFRVLRLLAGRPAPRATSFHVHTPSVETGAGEAIPRGDAAARQAALAASHLLVRRLTVIIASVVRRRRQAERPQSED